MAAGVFGRRSYGAFAPCFLCRGACALGEGGSALCRGLCGGAHLCVFGDVFLGALGASAACGSAGARRQCLARLWRRLSSGGVVAGGFGGFFHRFASFFADGAHAASPHSCRCGAGCDRAGSARRHGTARRVHGASDGKARCRFAACGDDARELF